MITSKTLELLGLVKCIECILLLGGQYHYSKHYPHVSTIVCPVISHNTTSRGRFAPSAIYDNAASYCNVVL